MRIELLPPRRPRIREQDIDMVSRLRDFLHKPLDIGHLRAVGRNGDGNGTGAFVWKCIEGGAGLLAGGGFAGGDVDFGAASLKEAEAVSMKRLSNI